MNPFINISIQPSFGKGKILICWNLRDEFDDGSIFVYRSVTGGKPWELISSEDEGITGARSFEDSFNSQDRLTVVTYKLVLEFEGQEYVSAPVGMFDQLTHREYGAVAKMMAREQLHLRSEGGIKIYHFIPLASGALSNEYDPGSGQRIKVNDPATDTFYGSRYGYAPPIESLIKIEGGIMLATQDRPDGTGAQEDVTVNARMLAHPMPRRGHVIVHTPTDTRYKVGEKIKMIAFKGIFPIYYETQLILLNRKDPAYRIPTP